MEPLAPLARISIILSWLFVGLACISATIQSVWIVLFVKRIRAGDICIYTALLIGIMLVAQMTWAMVDEGSARHQSDMMQQNVAATAKSLIISEALWSITGALIRVSGCCVLHALFAVSGCFSYVIRTTMGLCITHGIASVLELCLICRPLAAQWDPNIMGACGNQIVSFIIIEILGLLLDLVILISPLPIIWGIHMKVAKKVEVIVLLDAGVLLLMITCLRIKALKLAISTDVTYSKSYLGLLSSIGSMIGVVLCSTIALHKITVTFKGRNKKENSTTRGFKFQHSSQNNSIVAQPGDDRDV